MLRGFHFHLSFRRGLDFGHLLDKTTSKLLQGEKKCLKQLYFKHFFMIFTSSNITRYKYFIMGYKTKIQLINRAKSEQWYINFPSAVAQAMEFEKGETVEWLIDDHQRMVLNRSDEAVASLKKKLKNKKLP